MTNKIGIVTSHGYIDSVPKSDEAETLNNDGVKFGRYLIAKADGNGLLAESTAKSWDTGVDLLDKFLVVEFNIYSSSVLLCVIRTEAFKLQNGKYRFHVVMPPDDTYTEGREVIVDLNIGSAKSAALVYKMSKQVGCTCRLAAIYGEY